ncbi:MAG: TIGR04086 family membrane protein [Clostridia bacterium]|nr:TIGR04086 family membrane protein [Clostridia bacterium]
MKTKSGKEPKKKREGAALSAFKGAGGGLGVTLALLLLFCAILTAVEDPGPLVVPLSLASLYLGGIAAGVIGAKRSRNGSAGGFYAGCAFAAGVFLLSLLPLPSSAFPVSAAMIFLGLLLPAGALGGILGTKKQTKRHGRR